MKFLRKLGSVYYDSDNCMYIIKQRYAWLRIILLTFLTSIFGVGFYFIKDISTGVKLLLGNVVYEESKSMSEKKLEEISRKIDGLTQNNSLLRVALNMPAMNHVMNVGGSRSSYIFEGNDEDVLLSSVNELLRRATVLERSYEEILNRHEKDKKYYASIPTITPCDGRYSSTFGMRLHPIYKRMLHHSGVDFPLALNSNVYSTGDGIVKSAGKLGGYGNTLVINHGYKYQTIYAHLSKLKVKVGQHVKKGQVIAESGNTGISEAPHLHYEVVFDGKKQNPLNYFFDDDRLDKIISLN